MAPPSSQDRVDPDTGPERAHPLLSRHRLAMAVATLLLLGSLALLVVMAFEGGEEFAQRIDDRARDGFQAVQLPPLDWLATALGILGGVYVTWPLRVAVLIFLAVRRRLEALWAWVIAIAIYEPLVGILKNAYERPRPPDPQMAVTGFAFPSGHAVVGAAVAIGLVIVLVPAGPHRRNLEFAAGAFAFFMAASRIYLDAHWLTDVLAGTGLGAAIMIGVPAAVHEFGDWLHRRRLNAGVGTSAPP